MWPDIYPINGQNLGTFRRVINHCVPDPENFFRDTSRWATDLSSGSFVVPMGPPNPLEMGFIGAREVYEPWPKWLKIEILEYDSVNPPNGPLCPPPFFFWLLREFYWDHIWKSDILSGIGRKHLQDLVWPPTYVYSLESWCSRGSKNVH